MELLSIDRTLNIETGEAVMSGMYRDDEGDKTFVLRSDNPMCGKLYDLAISYIQSGDDLNDHAEEIISVIRKGENIAKGIMSDLDDLLPKFNDINLPIILKGNHFYVTLAGHDEPVDPVLEKKLIDAASQDDETTWHALVRFMQRLYSNTTRYVREQLFSWLEANFDDESAASAAEDGEYHGFTLMPDGRFIGYKGCMRDDDGKIVSINTGTSMSDGVQYTGHIPNPVGAIVEMPRVQVEDDPANGCSYGLHVGTWNYAQGWAHGVVLRVAVAPEDVVSIPLDCGYQKLRCCKYEVLQTTDVPVNEFMYGYDEDDWDDDDVVDDCVDYGCEDDDCMTGECECGDCINCGADSNDAGDEEY